MKGSAMIAIDIGENDKLVLFDGRNILEKPKAERGSTQAQKTAGVICWALSLDDVVLESPGIGASGTEPLAIREIVQNSQHKLFVISARAVKNLARDRGIPMGTMTDEDCARMIHEIATRDNAELREWRYVAKADKLVRLHTSVRPYDKRNYKDPQVDKWMQRLAPFNELPEDLQMLFTNGRKRNLDYAPARALPFAMAFDEAGSESRDGYERIIGLYSNGFPSFYRRATVSLMQRVAHTMFVGRYGLTGSGVKGKPKNQDISPELRKEALKATRRYIRKLYALSK
jgi:hypothetical protein